MSKVKSIPVIDWRGDELTVFEFYGGRFIPKLRRCKLCTGEDVIRTSSNSFRVIATGEELRRL